MSKIEYKAHAGETPFISACVDGKLDIAKALFAQGSIDLNTRTAADTNVLEELIFKATNRPKDFTITKLAGTDVTIEAPEEVRRILGSHPDDEFTIYLSIALFVLQNGANPDNINRNGQSAVFTAAGEGADWLIELLAQHRANLNMEDNWGLTPIHYACRFGNPDTVRLLLDRGAFINPQDDFGFSPAFEATAGKHMAVLKVLAEKGADFDLGLTKTFKTNPAGTTPLEYAKKHNLQKVTGFLQSINVKRLKIRRSVGPAEWKWEISNNGYEGVTIQKGKLLWYSHNEDSQSPSTGAVYQEFSDYLEKGPKVSGVPKDIQEKILAWIAE